MNPLFFSIFVALIGTAKCIICKCGSCESGTCNKTDTSTCYARRVIVSMENGSSMTYTQDGCIASGDCPTGSISISTEEGFFMRSNTKCCKSDNCNTDPPEVPKEDTTVRRAMCPSCLAVYPASCKPNMMTCAESENQCVNITGANTIAGVPVPFTARGCASPEVAVFMPGSYVYYSWNNFLVHTISMKPASNSASLGLGSTTFVVLLPSLIGILFTKFLS
ncbi:phospholipase A2 inhibitor and Ly6/PLAUR domain-containing protein-like [Anolis sagrei]|uniref:phospholipase A2 inhibitor and Ly6/PLAUR domain-containing protein-like n=1 Tax=Anolis sagrei TaxID=38937 RepID=UPI003521BB8C